MMGTARATADAEGTTPSHREPRQLLTVREAAEHFRVQGATIQRWCREGRLPALRRGKSWRIPAEAIESSDALPARDLPSQPDDNPRPNLALVRPAGGQHMLMVAEGSVSLEDVLSLTGGQSESVAALRIVRFRIGLADEGDRQSIATLSQAKRACEDVLGAVGDGERIVAMFDGDPLAAFSGDEADDWEDYLSNCSRNLPLTAICIHKAPQVFRPTMDSWTRCFAAHDLVWLRSDSSCLSLVPRQPALA